jgi:NhaA family Na+:H+ antiporter
VGWGVILGLVIGKPLGTVAAAALAVKLRIAKLPDEVGFSHLLGVGALGGIGFTVALFITDLAFEEGTVNSQARLAILIASLVAGVVGISLLLFGKHPVAADLSGPKSATDGAPGHH